MKSPSVLTPHVRRGAGWTIVLLVLLMPQAAALPVAGTANLVGPLSVPGGTLDARVLAAFLNDTKGSTLAGTVPVLEVTRVEWRLLAVNHGAEQTRVALDASLSTYRLHNVTISLVGDEGWAGFYPGPLSELTASTTEPLVIEPRATSYLGNAYGQHETNRASLPIYGQTVATPHLRANVTGAVETRGAYAFKLLGPDIILEADENTTTERTGRASRAGPVTDSYETWLLLEWSEGTIHLDAAQPLQIAASRAEAAWTGAAEATLEGGALETRTASYPIPARGTFSLTGTLTATMEAHQADAAALRLEGDLHTTSLPAKSHGLLQRLHEPALAVPAVLALLALLTVPLAVGAGYAAKRLAHDRRLRGLERELDRSLRPEDLTLTHNPAEAKKLIAGWLSMNRKTPRAAPLLAEAVKENSAVALAAKDDPAFRDLLESRPDVARDLDDAIARSDGRLRT